MSSIAGNRLSTPEAGHVPGSRTAQARNLSNLTRASADVTSLSQPPSRPLRPSSEMIGHKGDDPLDPQEQVLDQWIADIDQYESTLEDMAEATLDQDFKDELRAIEQWFRVLTEAERTAALYALLNQTTQVQNRFFIQVLQQQGKNHPISSVLSPNSFEKDPMASRMSDAMSRLSVGDPKNSLARNSTASKRRSELDPDTITAMFPVAAAALAEAKEAFTQKTGNPPVSNRNSAAARTSLTTPTISAPNDTGAGQNPQSPWNPTDTSRPKSSSGQQPPMGQFVAPPASGFRSPQPAPPPPISGNSNIQSTTLTADKLADYPLLSPAFGSSTGNWAATPMVSSFPTQSNLATSQGEAYANATAMKMAAMSTVNNRFALDDVRRGLRPPRAKSTEPTAPPQISIGGQISGMPAPNVIMVNEAGQIINRSLAIPGQLNPVFQSRSRPTSPGILLPGGMQSGFNTGMAFSSPQNNGFLSAYDSTSPISMGMGNGLAPMPMGQFGLSGYEGYHSDHSDMARGRSPRGIRRGSSKPPEDPTDPTLLQDIPSWLRSLRLHKYTDNLKDMNWKDLVQLDDGDLEKRGVNALGARRKMLKVFEQVRAAQANDTKG